MLHGATSVGLAALYLILPFADAANLIVLAPDAPRRTWDRTRGGFGPDVAFVDRALTTVFAHYAIDPNHIAIGGFSDGASYALSLGLTNGNLFTHVIAFSPGFFAPAAPIGRPRVFVSHGTRDEILPISGSRRIVEVLRGSGYDVTSVEFDGPHIVPFDIAHQAMDWFQRKEA
jgi:phospholipase/carboxylesterase